MNTQNSFVKEDTKLKTMPMAVITDSQDKMVYHTSEIIINSNGRILNTDREFCKILNCKSPNAIINSIILDYVSKNDKKIVVNAFIDTFYGKQESKLFKVKMINFQGKEVDVTLNFFPIKTSNGEKSTLVIRKKVF